MEKTSLNIICPEGVIDGCLFTKEKRQELYGKVAGGGGSRKPEEYQKEQIVLGTGRPCNNTQTRINWRKNEMMENAQPMRMEDGFDYTENFAGMVGRAANRVHCGVVVLELPPLRKKLIKNIFFEKQNHSKMSLYQGMAQTNPTKYPARMGKSWNDDEDIKLLTSIQDNKSTADIAAEHERTIGGINARRRELAADYWFNNNMPIEEIMTITGLSKYDIEKTIEKKSKAKKPSPPQSNEITELRREVTELKKTMMEMLELIKTLTSK